MLMQHYAMGISRTRISGGTFLHIICLHEYDVWQLCMQVSFDWPTAAAQRNSINSCMVSGSTSRC